MSILSHIRKPRLFRSRVVTALVSMVVAANGCGDDDSHACTAHALPSVEVAVLAPDGSHAVGAMASIVTKGGERRQCVGPVGDEAKFGCYDGVGSKLVEARQGDLVGMVEVSVPWSADGCQPVTQFAVIELGE